MSSGGAIAGAEAGRAFDKVRAAADIQYAPIPVPRNPPLERPQAETPAWLEAIGRFFRAVFEPLGNAIGVSWPVLQWVLLALAILGIGILLWRIVDPLAGRARAAAEPEEEGWTPAREAALALLDEADRLAAEGHFDQATHLLLQRSVAQIETARPGLLPPASTAREIAAHPALPERARGAFAAISTRVERAFYALRRLDAADWRAAREAYADFALARLDAA
ncbi:MAG: hypothetical protein ACREBO_08720 [Novosphingobium sp.]